MKKFVITLLLLSAPMAFAQKALLVGGSGTGKIAKIDKQTKEIIWEHALGAGTECNSVVYTKNGGVAYSYRGGAKFLDKSAEVVFDYKLPEGSGEELQSVSQIRGGGFLLGICGSPARIVEVSSKGKVLREVSYDTKIENHHGQFRQIRKTKKGTYIIPLLSRNSIVEVDKNGVELREIALGASPFSVTITRGGGWLVPCGHSGKVFSIDPNSEEVEVLVSNESLEGQANIEFGAQVVELRNGNLLMANWLGHNGDTSQPMLFEVDGSGDVVWSLCGKVGDISLISTVQAIY